MSKSTSGKKSTRGQRPSRRELRNSLVWPVAISVLIWGAAMIVWLVAPGRFDVLVSALIGIGLAIYLIHFLRSQRLKRNEQIGAFVMALPAIAGIAASLVLGLALFAITGVAMTLLLLSSQQLLTTPISYRFARRRFFAGDMSSALKLVDKAIIARPMFWESYQLRSLIYLTNMRFDLAERDARQALVLRPDAHPVYNTLGQLYLATNRFSEARDAYWKAVELNPKSSLYHYHLGLTEYRLGNNRQAAEALSTATQIGLPSVSYELLTYYYLLHALELNGETEKAEEVEEALQQFNEGLPQLKEDLAHQPDFPHLPLMRRDLGELEKRLTASEATQTQ